MDNNGGVDKIVVFASDSALHALANAKICHMDGMFATASRMFYQIVTLHGFVLGVMLPLVFGLLPLLAMPFIPVPHLKDALEFVKSITPDVLRV